jgi:hypothetical protein
MMMVYKSFAGMKIDLLLQKEKGLGLEQLTIWEGYK